MNFPAQMTDFIASIPAQMSAHLEFKRARWGSEMSLFLSFLGHFLSFLITFESFLGHFLSFFGFFYPIPAQMSDEKLRFKPKNVNY